MHPLIAISIVAGLIPFGLVGCDSPPNAMPPGTTGSRAQPLEVPEMAWPFWPERMRVHPLSYIVDDSLSGQTVVEARLEFFDFNGHTSRCVGVARIELHDAGDLFSSEPLVWWRQDLTNLELNARFYDDVTRTYLMRLELDPVQIPRRPHLTVEFRSADGREFAAEYDLPDRRVEPMPSPDRGGG